MTTAATVTVDFAAETARFVAELKKVNSRLASIEGAFGKVKQMAAGFLGGVSVAGMGSFIKTAAEAADQLGSMSDQLGESTETLKGFHISAREAGVEMGSANKMLSEAQKRLAEASMGSGEAAKYIQLLGLNIQDLRRKSPVELFEAYSEAISQLSSRGEQMAAASALMGKEAAGSLVFIQQGAAAISDAAGFVDQYSLALSRVETEKIKVAADSMARLGDYSESVGQRIAAGLSPFIAAIAEDMLDGATNTEKFQAAAEMFGSVAYTAFAVVANAARSLQAAFFAVAAGGARMLQSLTFGDLSESFAAAADVNLAKADAALQQIKSIEQIQAGIAQVLEKARADAAAAVEQQRQASQGGDLSLSFDPMRFDLTKQYADMTAQLNSDAAEAQMRIEQQITDDFARQLEERAMYRRNFSAGQNAFVTAEEQNEAAAQQAIIDSRNAALGAGVDALQTYAAQSKSAAKALVVIEKGQAIASAIMNTYVGATKQLAGGDPYTAIPRAAMVVAFGLAQVAMIAKQAYGQISQISSSPSAGAPIGSPTNPVYTQSQSSSNTSREDSSESVLQINIHGNFFGNRETINYLVEQFREEINNRDVVLFSPTSRQAQELAVPS